MIEADEHPLAGDAAIIAALHQRADALDTLALTSHARALGLHPPDNRTDWLLVREYADDGTDRGLFWIGPDDD